MLLDENATIASTEFRLTSSDGLRGSELVIDGGMSTLQTEVRAA